MSSTRSLADPYASSVMKGDQAHATGSIPGKALHGHIRHHIAAVVNVGCLPEGRICSAYIVVVASQHDGADLTLADHPVKAESDLQPS